MSLRKHLVGWVQEQVDRWLNACSQTENMGQRNTQGESGWKTLLPLASLKELKLAWHGSICLYPALRGWKQEN